MIIFVGLICCVCVCVCAFLVSHVWLFATPWTVAHQAPLSMGFPRKMVSCHFLLQGIFPTQTQRLNQCLLHWWADSLPVSHLLLLLLLSRFSRVRLCASPKTAAQPGSPVPGILQARHWNELPFPSPVHESESEVSQLCPTLSYPMDCSPPGSSAHGIFQARVLGSPYLYDN